MPRKPKTTYRMTRTNTTRPGSVLDYPAQTLHEARQHIAWCATDNLGMTRTAAANAANVAPVDGTPHNLDVYVFTITPERTV